MIDVRNLRFAYSGGDKPAVRGIDFFAYLALLAALMTWLARRAFGRFIVRGPGGG